MLPCFLDRNRLRRDSRVTVSRTATASATSPASWPVRPGRAKASGEEAVAGVGFCWPPPGLGVGEGPGAADGLIAGNSPDALPAPMSWLEMPLRFGMGPSGSVGSGVAPADDRVGAADAEVTVTVSAADGGVHFAEVAMPAVAVSVTEVTEVALAATGICALRLTVCLSDIEPTVQVAVPSPLAHPLVNAGCWLDGRAARVTDTPGAEAPFSVDTRTV